VARDSDQRSAQPKCHVLDEARFPAACRAFEHDRHPALGGSGEQADFTAHIGIIRLLPDAVLPDVELTSLLHHDWIVLLAAPAR
jgi:hypothetical protein